MEYINQKVLQAFLPFYDPSYLRLLWILIAICWILRQYVWEKRHWWRFFTVHFIFLLPVFIVLGVTATLVLRWGFTSVTLAW